MSQPQKHIIQIITKMVIGGASEHTVLLSAFLPEEKYSIEILAGTPQKEAMDYMRTIVPNIQLQYTEVPELVNSINPIKNLYALFHLYRYLKGNNVQIVHTNSSIAGIIGRLSAKLAKVSIIVHTVHGWSFTDYDPPLKRIIYVYLERIAAKYTTKIITVTQQDIERGLHEKIGSASQYQLIHTGIDFSFFSRELVSRAQLRRELNILPDYCVIGTITRFDKMKAPEDFLAVAKKVIFKHPNCLFIMVGDGPRRQEMETLINQMGIRSNILLTGYRKDLQKIIPVFDIFLFTSLKEGLPRVLPQVMYHRIPVVTTYIDGIKEIIIDGKNGFTASPHDIGTLSTKTINLVEDTQLREKLGQNGFDTIYPEFSLSNMVKKTDNLYAEIIKLNSKHLTDN